MGEWEALAARLGANEIGRGGREIVVEALTHTLANVVVEALFDGLVVYRTSSPVAAIQKIRFCNNSFLLLHWERCASEQKVEPIVQRLFAKANLQRAAAGTSARSVRSFRIYVSKENSTISVDLTLLTGMEKAIAQQLKLTVNRALRSITRHIGTQGFIQCCP